MLPEDAGHLSIDVLHEHDHVFLALEIQFFVVELVLLSLGGLTLG